MEDFVTWPGSVASRFGAPGSDMKIFLAQHQKIGGLGIRYGGELGCSLRSRHCCEMFELGVLRIPVPGAFDILN
jgi:hypothetical protein